MGQGGSWLSVHGQHLSSAGKQSAAENSLADANGDGVYSQQVSEEVNVLTSRLGGSLHLDQLTVRLVSAPCPPAMLRSAAGLSPMG